MAEEKKHNDTKDMLTAREAARLCSVSLVTFKKWIKEGKVRAFKTPGGHYRISRYEVSELLIRLHELVEQEHSRVFRPGKKQILVVDDEIALLELVTDVLEHEGFEVVKATSVLNASLLVGRHNPDIILLDIALEALNGWEFFEILRNDNRTKNIPVIFMSGMYKSDADVKKAMEMGASGFLMKPFNLQQFLGTLEQVMPK